MRVLFNSPLWSFRELVVILLVAICIDRIAIAENEAQVLQHPDSVSVVLEKSSAK